MRTIALIALLFASTHAMAEAEIVEELLGMFGLDEYLEDLTIKSGPEIAESINDNAVRLTGVELPGDLKMQISSCFQVRLSMYSLKPKLVEQYNAVFSKDELIALLSANLFEPYIEKDLQSAGLKVPYLFEGLSKIVSDASESCLTETSDLAADYVNKKLGVNPSPSSQNPTPD